MFGVIELGHGLKPPWGAQAVVTTQNGEVMSPRRNARRRYISTPFSSPCLAAIWRSSTMTLAASSGGNPGRSRRQSCSHTTPGRTSACSWARSSAWGLRLRLSITWRKSIRRSGPLWSWRRCNRGSISMNWLRRNRSSRSWRRCTADLANTGIRKAGAGRFSAGFAGPVAAEQASREKAQTASGQTQPRGSL